MRHDITPPAGGRSPGGAAAAPELRSAHCTTGQPTTAPPGPVTPASAMPDDAAAETAQSANRRDIETEINRAIGRRIRTLRLARGFSQEACSTQLGISFQQLQKYEKGQNRISACALYRLAGILDVPPSALLDRLDDGPKVLRRNRISRGMIEASTRLASMEVSSGDGRAASAEQRRQASMAAASSQAQCPLQTMTAPPATLAACQPLPPTFPPGMPSAISLYYGQLACQVTYSVRRTKLGRSHL